MRHDLMTFIDTPIRDRPAGQPASAESIERDQRLSVKAAEIAKLRDLRLASIKVRTEALAKRIPRRLRSNAGRRT
jgi:hypothetical protein